MNLRSIREAAGLSQKQLAELMHVDQSTVQRAETMHHSAKLATYAKAAKVLGVSLEAMFSQDRSAEESELLAGFRAMPPTMKRSVLAMAHEILRENSPSAAEKSKAGDHPSVK